MCVSFWACASASRLEGLEKADPFLKLGRFFFAFAFLCWGVKPFVCARSVAGLGPPWYLGRPLWVCLIGVAFVAAGAAILIGQKARLAATFLATVIFLFFLLLYIPRIVAQLHNPGPWTSRFEILALSGRALVLAT